jgi:GT2 family glycosyltransferase
MKLSIIIVNHNTADLLSNCLQSVFAHPPSFDFEIIVFDNNSSDHSGEILKQFPNIRAILNPINIGFAAASNRAAEIGRGEFLFFLNPDTETRPGAIDLAVNYLEQSEFGILGVRLRHPDGKIQVSSGNFPSLKTMLVQNIYMLLVKSGLSRALPILGRGTRVPVSQLFQDYGIWNPLENHETDWVSGAFLLLRREDFFRIGKFDEYFFLFGEDIDLCYRLRKGGMKTVYAGNLEILHHGSSSSANFPVLNFLRHYNSTYQFYRKHYSRLQANLYRFVIIFSFSLACILLRIKLFLVKSNERQKAQARLDTFSKLITQFLRLRGDNKDVGK